jgi:hypothetical protein
MLQTKNYSTPGDNKRKTGTIFSSSAMRMLDPSKKLETESQGLPSITQSSERNTVDNYIKGFLDDTS